MARKPIKVRPKNPGEIINDKSAVSRVFARITGNRVDAMVRADSKAIWNAAAKAQNLLVEETTEDGEIIWVPDKGVHIDEIGPILTTPATYDRNGKELTPAIWDTRHHVNFRVVGEILDRKNTAEFEKWKVTALNWTSLGTVEVSNKSEDGRKLSGVTLLDPETISTPQRIWQTP